MLRLTRVLTQRVIIFTYGAITHYGGAFQLSSINDDLCNSVTVLPNHLVSPTTPITQRRQALTRNEFRLFPVRSPLLGESLI